MADEKITNTDEILSEDQLEQVAGGKGWEIEDDLQRFKDIGVLPYWTSTDATENANLAKETFARYGVQVKYSFADKNAYFINGRPAQVGEVWDRICAIEGVPNPFRK